MIPIPAALFFGYALLGVALFLFSAGVRGFLEREEAPAQRRRMSGRRRGAVPAQAVAALVLATLLLLVATISLLVTAVRLL